MRKFSCNSCDVASWHFSEVAPFAFGDRSRFQSGLSQTVYRHVYEFTSGAQEPLQVCFQQVFVSSCPSSSSCTCIGTVLLEDASRFARDLMVQERGIAALSALGVRLVTSSGDDLLGAVAQVEKARVVAKLKHGRDPHARHRRPVRGT